MPDLLKVLLIDDNPDDRHLIIRELKKLFIIDVEEIINQGDFDAALKRLDFDIVITDYQLRWTTGVEVLITIKKIKPLMPVIMFTGTGSEEIAVMAMKVGLDDYILKSPQHYMRLALSVNSAINRMKEELLRKQAENALRKSEENYRTLVENIEIGFARLDANGRIVMVNEAQGRMFRLATSEFTGKKGAEFYVNGIDYEAYHASEWTGEAVTQAIRADKTTFEVQLRSFPSLNDDGTVNGFIEISEDISARLLSERTQLAALNIGNAVLETETLDELINIIKQELSRIVSITNVWVVLAEKKPKTGITLQRLGADDFNPGWFAIEDKLVSDAIEQEKVQLLKGDELISASGRSEADPAFKDVKVWAGIPLRGRRQVIGMLVFIHNSDANALNEPDVDLLQFVSNQIGIAIDNRISADNLRDSELQFRSVIEQSADGIVIADQTGNVIECNPAAVKLSDLKIEDILGRKLWEIGSLLRSPRNVEKSLNEEFRKKYNQLIGKLTSGEPVNTEFSFVTPHDEKKYLEVTLFPLSIKGIQHTGLFFKDTTQHRISVDAIAHARRRAEESDRLKTVFLSNISYEIRNPLNAIVGYAELLSLPSLSKQEREQYSQQIFENSSSLLEQFNNIIEISKFDAGSVSLQISEFQVNSFIDEIASGISSLSFESGLDFRVFKAISDEMLILRTDRTKLQQAIRQLLYNAFKFTASGFVELGYYTSKRDNITFYVSDSGPGIPANKANLIFDRFRQAEENIERRYTGLGIGLHIVKKIVNLLNGEAYYEPAQPKGSIFKIVIPLVINSEGADLNTETNASIFPASNMWIGKTILIVEDVESNFLFLEAALRRSGAALIWAVSGEEAIRLIGEDKPVDLVLMDIRLNGIDGYEVTRKIKAIRPGLTIIAQTAYALVGEREKARRAGCDDYLAKPIRPSILLGTLGKYL